MKPEQSRSKPEQGVRVPLIAPADLLEKIDDWGFANRIRSRGEAIRRLAAKGLEAENTKAGEAA